MKRILKIHAIEAMTGPVYLAILVARLVAQQMSQRLSRKA